MDPSLRSAVMNMSQQQQQQVDGTITQGTNGQADGNGDFDTSLAAAAAATTITTATASISKNAAVRRRIDQIVNPHSTTKVEDTDRSLLLSIKKQKKQEQQRHTETDQSAATTTITTSNTHTTTTPSSTTIPQCNNNSTSSSSSSKSRVRKKKRKLAQKFQEKIHAIAQETMHTGSVCIVDSAGLSGIPIQSTIMKTIATTTATQARSMSIITSCTLPPTEPASSSSSSISKYNPCVSCVLPRPSPPPPPRPSPPCPSQQTGKQPSTIPPVLRIVVQPLLVLDLNGILCHRIRSYKEQQPKTGIFKYRPASFQIAGTPVIVRPFLEQFLCYLNTHFCLAVWTSAQSKTAKQLVTALFPASVAQSLLFVWGQSKCKASTTTTTTDTTTATSHGSNNASVEVGRDTLFEKELHKVWNEFPLWNASNTLLLDDSPEKCDSFRRNALHPPPLHGQDQQIKGGIKMLESKWDWKSDQVNVALQMEFFEKLVAFWNQPPPPPPPQQQNEAEEEKGVLGGRCCMLWDEVGELQGEGRRSEQRLWEFLQDHATGVMGWRL